MPRPTSGTTLQRPDLGVLMFEYFMDAVKQGFIGKALLPLFPVAEKSADYPIIPIESILKLPEDGGKRAARSAYGRDDFEFDTGQYACKEYGREAPIDNVEAAMYQRYFDAEEVAVMRATLILLRLHEIRAKTMLFNTATFEDSAVSVAWSTAATADPEADAKTARTSMRTNFGIEPNVAVMSRTIFDNAMVTAAIKEALQYTAPVQMASLEAKRAILAQFLGVEEVLVAGGMYDAAKKGQSASLSEIWGTDTIGFFRIADSEARDLREPVVGRTFQWTGEGDPAADGLIAEQYEEPQINGHVYRIRHHTDERLVYAGAGYLLTGASG